MKTEITYRQLRNAIANKSKVQTGELVFSPLNKLATASLSVTMMHWFGRTADDARKQYEQIEKDKTALIDKYKTKISTPHKEGEETSETDEADVKYEITPENEKLLNAEWEELLDSTTEIVCKTFTVEEMAKYEDKLAEVGFVGDDFKLLDWMIVWPEETASNVESIEDHKAQKAAA